MGSEVDHDKPGGGLALRAKSEAGSCLLALVIIILALGNSFATLNAGHSTASRLAGSAPVPPPAPGTPPLAQDRRQWAWKRL